MARSREESLIDQAFARLKEADGFEQDDPELAANKYHEGCFLLKNHIRTVLSRSQNKGEAGKMRALLAEKIDKYELRAEHLRTRSKMMEEDRQKKEQNRENSRLRQSTSSSLSSSCNWEMIAHNSQSIRPSGLNTVASSRSLHIDNIEKVATQHASKAGRLLTSAIDHDEIGGKCDDEVIQLYLQSVQHYLDAIKFLSSGGADDGAEDKTSQERKQEESYADVHRDLVVSLKRKVKGALDRVEELKSRRGAGSTSSGLASAETNVSEIPVAQQTSLTPHEIDVLKTSSRLASVLVLPWSDTDVKTFNFSPSNRYNDPDGRLKLSKKQEIAFSKWARPDEIAEMRGLTSSNIKLIESITPYTIKQYCVSDCSFIAGLCISAAYERRFRRRLVSSLIHPQDKNGMPLYNPKGVYMVKLWLNGVERRVTIDDLFPIDSRGNLLCSHTNTAGLELWVPLLEKAYMKICGGYDFPGSNSGVDLFSLTGWIPERIHFPEDVENVQTFETPPERCWERLYSASAYGDCLITMSTSKELTEDKAEEVGLFTGHAYAVLDVVKTSNGTRLLQLKNPWAKSGWLGRFSSRDQESWADDPGLSELGYDPKIASHYDDGVFFISWEDVMLYFRNIHLSWSDSLFCCSTKVHDLWRKDRGPIDDSYNVGENPQYCITLSDAAMSTNATLWVLLSRHVDKQEQEGGEASCFATVHIHRVRTASERVWYTNSKCVLTGAYTNNQHVLIRYDASGKQDKHLVLVLSQYKKSADLAYTLTALCTEDFALSSPESLPHSKTLHGSWRIRENMQDKSCLLSIGTAGGPAGRGSFGCNPHFFIHVKEGMDMQISCKTNKLLLVNVILVESTGRRMQHIYMSPTLDSGAYRHGFCITDVSFVPPGDYTLVVSTFEPGQEGAFVLCVSSSKDLRIRELD